MSQYLFAYGTLQLGLTPAQMAHVAAFLTPVAEGFGRGTLYDLGGYPGAVPDANAAGRIFGTVMQLPDDPGVLRQLDEYEGFDPRNPEESGYVRELRKIELASGGTVECWFYRYNWNPDGKPVIAGGDWRKLSA